MMIEVRLIDAAATYPLRQEVLRPGQPASQALFPGDDLATTLHLGAFDAGTLVGIASLYAEAYHDVQSAFRLRGMAVAPGRQRQGVGRYLLDRCVVETRSRGGKLLWCNARTSAEAFYADLGFARHGDVFDIAGVGPHYVMSRPL